MKSTVKLTKKEQAAIQEAALIKEREDKKKIRCYSPDTWKKIETWGRESQNLSQHLQSYCFAIAGKIRKNEKFEGFEVSNGIKILEVVADQAPELLVIEEPVAKVSQHPPLEVCIEVIAQAVQWDKKNKKWKNISYTFMSELATGKKPLSEQNKKIAAWNLETVQKCGFEYKPVVPTSPTTEQ